MAESDADEDDNIPPPLCVFCNAPWADGLNQTLLRLRRHRIDVAN